MSGDQNFTEVIESNSLSREPSFFKSPEQGSEAKGNQASALSDCVDISRSSSVCKGSEEDVQYKCDPCSTAGDEADVTGYCVNCEEYLCSDCYKNHPRNKASRNHSLLDKDSMPKKEMIYCDPCGMEEIEEEAHGYCKECGDYLCGSCYKSHSRNKASRKHTLLDKDSMPKNVKKQSMTSSFAKFGIRSGGDQSLWCRNRVTDNQDFVIRTVGNMSGGLSLMPNSPVFVIKKTFR